MKKFISFLMSAIISAAAVPATVSGSSDIDSSTVFSIEIIDSTKKTAVITTAQNVGESLVIPQSINDYTIISIDDKAFFGCTELASVTFPDTLKTIGANAFAGCFSLKNVELPDSVTEVGKGCFMSCTELESADLGKGVSVVPENCFYACTALNSFDFTNITELGTQSFYGCAELSGSYIPSSVTAFGEDSIGKHYSIRNGGTETISGFALRCDGNSAAEKYINSNNIRRIYDGGDADLDGKITSADAALVLQEYASLSGGNKLSFTEKQRVQADINTDGKINASDSAIILMIYAGEQSA